MDKPINETILTKTMEDYLETIYLLEKASSEARVSDIAEKLGVAKSSVHKAMHVLTDKGFITHQRYRTVHLTEEGKKTAVEIYEHHLDIKRFFMEVLKLDEELAEKDACATEHVLSHGAIDAMKSMLKVKK